MHEIKWSDELNTGIKKIDQQHKELLRIANVLIKAVSMGREQRILNNVLRRLREYTVTHFICEEKLMEDVRFPDRGAHANEHARLKKEVKDFQRSLYKHENLTPETIISFLRGWLLDHILQNDRNLAKFIHDNTTTEHRG